MQHGALHESFTPIEPLDSTAVRLRRSVAAWDVEAHRALLSNRSTAVLHVLAHLEAATVKAVQAFVTQAVHAGFIDHLTGARLLPVLQDSSMSWESLRDAAAELSFASTTIPISFIDSARDLQEAFLNAVHTTAEGDRVGVLRAASSHLDTSVAIAGATCDLIAAGELRAPARAIARLLAEQDPEDPPLLASPVSAVAIHRGLSLPLDARGRRLLERSAERAFANAHETVNRASGLASPQHAGRRRALTPLSDTSLTEPVTDFALGQRLVEVDLSESSTPAGKRCARAGGVSHHRLVERVASRGARVRTISFEEAPEIYEVPGTASAARCRLDVGFPEVRGDCSGSARSAGS